jgi:8-oxo-dGTP pyrophosphatase MutT (NUDIX family)
VTVPDSEDAITVKKNRKPLIHLLDSHKPFDTHEGFMLDRLREFVSTQEDCFERSLPAGHVTGSAWVVDLEREHVLLTYHVKLERWLQLGGHADGDPDVLKVAIREALEESGLENVRPVTEDVFDVDIHEIPAGNGEPAHFHYDVRFLLEADRRSPLRITAESKSLEWVRLEDVRRMVA